MGILSTVYSDQPVGGVLIQYLWIFAMHTFWATDGYSLWVCVHSCLEFYLPIIMPIYAIDNKLSPLTILGKATWHQCHNDYFKQNPYFNATLRFPSSRKDNFIHVSTLKVIAYMFSTWSAVRMWFTLCCRDLWTCGYGELGLCQL